MATKYTIHIHAIPLSDDNGARATSITREAFDEAIGRMSEYFTPADIRFAFDPNTDWRPRKSTSLNRLSNGNPGQWWKEANAVAAQHRGKLVIFLRWGSDKTTPANNWFAYPPNTGQAVPPLAKLPTDNVDFVAITNQADKFGAGAAPVLAHEIGHYLGLFHTHPTWGDPDPDKIIDIVKKQGVQGVNGDLLSDTAPDPGKAYYKAKVSSDVCGGPASFKIAGKTFKPDRANFMSYYNGCQPPVRMSPQQIAVMRKTLSHKTRAHLIEASKGTRFLGVFRAGTDAHALWVGDSWTGFNAKWKALSKQGLRLIDIETYMTGNKRRYAGVFRAGTDAHALWAGDDWAGFNAKWKALSKQGLRLIDIETYVEGNKRRYIGVFRAGADAHALWAGDDWAGFNAKWKALAKQGLRLTNIETYVEGNKRRYIGVFRAGTDAHALWAGDDWDGFNAKWKALSKQGLRLIDLETYVEGNKRRYIGVFRAGTDAHALWAGDDWDGFNAKWQELSKQGLRLVDMEVYGSSVS